MTSKPMTGKGFRAARVRNEIARGVVGGLSLMAPLLSGVWRFLDGALADVSAVLAALEEARTDRANLLAAIRCTLDAHADGEDDPLWYIRDELNVAQMPSRDHGRAS